MDRTLTVLASCRVMALGGTTVWSDIECSIGAANSEKSSGSVISVFCESLNDVSAGEMEPPGLDWLDCEYSPSL